MVTKSLPADTGASSRTSACRRRSRPRAGRFTTRCNGPLRSASRRTCVRLASRRIGCAATRPSPSGRYHRDEDGLIGELAIHLVRPLLPDATRGARHRRVRRFAAPREDRGPRRADHGERAWASWSIWRHSRCGSRITRRNKPTLPQGEEYLTPACTHRRLKRTLTEPTSARDRGGDRIFVERRRLYVERLDSPPEPARTASGPVDALFEPGPRSHGRLRRCGPRPSCRDGSTINGGAPADTLNEAVETLHIISTMGLRK